MLRLANIFLRKTEQTSYQISKGLIKGMEKILIFTSCLDCLKGNVLFYTGLIMNYIEDRQKNRERYLMIIDRYFFQFFIKTYVSWKK